MTDISRQGSPDLILELNFPASQRRNRWFCLPLNKARIANLLIDWNDGSPIQRVSHNTTGRANKHTDGPCVQHCYPRAKGDQDTTYSVKIYPDTRTATATPKDRNQKVYLDRFGDGTYWWENVSAIKSSVGWLNTFSLVNLFNCKSAPLFDPLFRFPDVTSLDVSRIKYMRGMFEGAQTFNQPIGCWNTFSVIDMSRMFQRASLFNQPLDTWDVSHVINMSDMFRGAVAFNQAIGCWNTSSAIDMSGMFDSACSFNQPLNTWDVSNVTNMSRMFRTADAFDQDLSDWKTGKVANMSMMFYGAWLFNGDISSWDTSQVTSMNGMFFDANAFNQSLSRWNVSKVVDMSDMFHNGASFNKPLDAWKVSGVRDMSFMFFGATSFKHRIDNWNISDSCDVTDMFGISSTCFEPERVNYVDSRVDDGKGMTWTIKLAVLSN